MGVAVTEIECITLNGRMKLVKVDQLILRPAVYGVIVQDSKLLVLRMRETGKYHLPGGGIHGGERLEAALKREIREETGIEVDGVKLAHFEEIFFYYDPSDRAYHGLHFFFTCEPKTVLVLADDEVDDKSAECPRWVEIRDLKPTDFQAHGDAILDLCR
jgi:nucleoside triphosphatase